MSTSLPRRVLKLAVFIVCLALVSPLIAVAWLESRLAKGEWLFTACAQLLALAPSHAGTLLRGAYYFATLEQCSWETNVGFGSLFTHRAARLADHVSTGAYCVIGHAHIGPRVIMGSRVSVPSGKRQHFGAGGTIVAESRYDTVTIGAGSWIGEGAIVMADVGASCIVAAGAVVSEVVPDACVAGGNPARVIRKLE